jgi:Mg-chelatase subunit ChlD
LYDALVEAADSLHKDKTPARRMIIVITDGEENHSAYSLDSSIAHALKAEAAIYAVNVTYLINDEDAKEGESRLKRLADATGGNYLQAGEDGELKPCVWQNPARVTQPVCCLVQTLGPRGEHISPHPSARQP